VPLLLPVVKCSEDIKGERREDVEEKVSEMLKEKHPSLFGVPRVSLVS